MKTLLTILAGILFLTACTKDIVTTEELPVEASGDAITRAVTASSTQNPYSLANVQKAYNEMAAELNMPEKTLTPTHYYVRFAVKDTVDLYILHDSLQLELFDYPLDRDLTDDEMAAYEADTTDHWNYTAVPVGFVYPEEVKHEVLDNIYMQSEITRVGTTPQIADADYEAVIERSMCFFVELSLV